MIDKLLAKYWEYSQDRHPDLEQFTRQLAEGAFGPVEPADIAAFLREVEAITIANIETKATEGGPFAAMRGQVIEETRAHVAQLIALYGDPQTSDRDAPPEE